MEGKDADTAKGTLQVTVIGTLLVGNKGVEVLLDV